MKTTFKPFLKKTAITTILGGASLCIVFLFCSCENFLKAQGTAEVIQQAIDYANSTKYSIKVESEKGSGIVTKPAAGEALVKVTDIFNLSFSSESDSQFIKWEAYNSKTGEAFTDNTYLQIENPLMIDTTCTFVKDPENENIQLAVRAVTAKRPRIIRATPVDQETGVPRNSQVRISFDKFNMDPECIYYTEEEIQTLKTELGLKDSEFLQGDNEHCDGKYYGYKKDDKHFFKNIQIVSSPVTGSSLTKYFYDPYWEKDPNDMGGSTLVIQTTNPPPPKNVVVYVTLAKDFCYYAGDIAVTFREANTISYKTMYDMDRTAPEFFVPKDSQNKNDYHVMKFKNANGEFISLPYTKDAENSPFSIPVCDDINYITVSFSFTATAAGGSGIANRFRLYCKPESSASSYQYNPYVEIPYSKVTPDTGYTQWSEEYIIPRSDGLRDAGTYCFLLEAINNDGREQVLLNDNHDVVHFWLQLSQNEPNY